MPGEMIVFDGVTRQADRLIDDGVGAIVVPSFAYGTNKQDCNVVFWGWQAECMRDAVASADDIDGRLAKAASVTPERTCS